MLSEFLLLRPRLQKFLQFTVEHLPRLAVAVFVINILRAKGFGVQVDAGEVREIHLPIHLQDTRI